MLNEKNNIKNIVKKSKHLIENWLDYYVYKNEMPGMAVGLYIDDETIFNKAYGYSNLNTKEKLSPNHLFRIASHSKLFTATGIMKLYEKNKLSLDDKVIDILPWFKSNSESERENIRIKHLISHSSGITRDGDYGHWFSNRFPDEDGFKEQILKEVTIFSTNEQIKYSNYAFTLLGLIIEKISGLTYSEFIQKEILDPLDMKNTVIDVNENNETTHCSGHGMKFPGKVRKNFPHVPAKVMTPATGISSNVEDLIKFYKGHLLGNDILFPDYVKREMQSIKSSTDDGSIQHGLGFKMTNVGSEKFVGHAGSYPGFTTYSGMSQSKKIVIVILTNALDTNPGLLFIGLMNLINKINKSKHDLIQEDQVEQDYSSIIGFYSSIWDVSLYSQIGCKLVSISPNMSDASLSFQIYSDDGGLKFKIPNNFPYGSPGQYFKFDVSDLNNTFITISGGVSKRFNFEY